MRRVLGLWLALPLLALAACGGRGIGAENDNQHNENDNQNQNRPDPPLEIHLTVYNSSGEVVETRTVDGMGPVRIAPASDEPEPGTPRYVVMAVAEGHYTQLRPCDHGETIDVQLDAVPALSRALTGVVIRSSYFGPPAYHAEGLVEATGPGGESASLTTDAQGRYRLTDGTEGTWHVSVRCGEWEEPFPSTFDLPNGAGTDYQDLFVLVDMSADAPNLYLYPERTTDVSVRLGFPVGGEVVLSDPPYEEGWQVSVAPDGTVDGAYPYLFYEARLPYQVQRERGWLLSTAELEAGFEQLLRDHGFVGREITDFLDFWLPLMTDAPYYAICPMAADSLVTLHIHPAPDRLRRLWLYMQPLEAPVSLEPPTLPAPLSRDDGFTAVEWGAFLSR